MDRNTFDQMIDTVEKQVKDVQHVLSAVEQLQRFGVIRKVDQLDANGEYQWVFGINFDKPPSLHAMYFEVGNNLPIILKGQSWVMDGNKYAGVVFKAYRSQRVPALTPVTGLLAAITGAIFNTLVNALNTTAPFATPSDLKGVGIHMTASPT